MANVIVLGASDKKERTSNQAVRMLAEYQHTVLPVHPGLQTIDGHPVYASVRDASATHAIDVISLYVNPTRQLPVVDDIIAAKPGAIIMNPGTESDDLRQQYEQAGIRVIEACTLVLLRSQQFETALAG